MIAGVDEAGRGPVLGPLVMAIVAVDKEKELQKLGVKDSKLLTPEKREILAEKLKSYEHEIISVNPSKIDDAVAEKELNLLEARTTAVLIDRLAKRIPLERVIIDAPMKNTEKYEKAVQDVLDSLGTKKITLQCENKADLNHPVAGAASILAKVTRDAAMRSIESEHGDVGSGYPSDPKTQAFLSKHWKEGHDFFRKSWESYKRLAQSSLEDFKKPEHTEEIKAFEILKEHGFEFQEPTNQYEVVRMKKGKTTIIKYNTGKLVIQGPEKESVEKLLMRLGI